MREWKNILKLLFSFLSIPFPPPKRGLKLLSCSYQKKQNSSNKKKKRNRTELTQEDEAKKKTKKQRRRRRKGLSPVKKKTKKQRRRRWRTMSYESIRPEEVFEFRLESTILPDTARVGANQPDSMRIGPSLCRVGARRKKKKGRSTNSQAAASLARRRIGRRCGGRFAASMHPSPKPETSSCLNCN